MAEALTKNILCAVNGSIDSVHAAMYAMILAKEFKLNLYVVYVVDTITVNFLQQSPLFQKEEKITFEKDLWTDGRDSLEKIAALAKSKNIRIYTEILDGQVVSCIKSYAEKIAADMILIGGHEESGKIVSSKEIRPAVCSNVRDEMIKSSRCPVMVVQMPKIEALFKIL